MTNNFELIKPLLKWRTDDDFFFCQILQRKKDAKDLGQTKISGSNNNSRLIKAYYIKSLESLIFYQPEIIELCNLFNARAGINLNRRSFEKMALQCLRKVTDQIINKSFDKVHKAYPSVCGAYNHDSDKKWIVDVDSDDNNNLNWNVYESRLQAAIRDSAPKGNKIITKIPTKNGFHLISKPFNVIEFQQECKELMIKCPALHKNNPTLVYCP